MYVNGRSPGAKYFTFGVWLFLAVWILLGEVFFGGPEVALYLPHRQLSPMELRRKWETSNRGLDHDTIKRNVGRILDKYGTEVAVTYINCHQTFDSYANLPSYRRDWPECDKLDGIVYRFDHPEPKPWWHFW